MAHISLRYISTNSSVPYSVT